MVYAYGDMVEWLARCTAYGLPILPSLGLEMAYACGDIVKWFLEQNNSPCRRHEPYKTILRTQNQKTISATGGKPYPSLLKAD